VTTFFVPGTGTGQEHDEQAYAAICALAEQDTGRVPRARRIFSLWSRRSGTDCVTEVGRPDPIHGDMVLAILDMGRNLPYVIHCGSPGDEASAIREVVGNHVYAVTEFTR
jgi:hypothetical protein